VVVPVVGRNDVRVTTRPTALAPHRWHSLKQRDGLVTSLRLPPVRVSELDASGVGDQVVLAASSTPINRASSGLGAPFNARMWEPSTAAREKSKALALRSLARRTSYSRGHTPASVHSARRGQQVMPEPKRSSCGRCSYEIPVCSTNRMPGKPAGLDAACVPDAGPDAQPWAAAARPPPTTRHRLPTASAELPHPPDQ
jgi:hypothetical protein